MKALYPFLFLSIVSLSSEAQENKSYELRIPVPTIYMNGNLFDCWEKYDHVPTTEDSALFNKKCQKLLKAWSDSLEIMERKRTYQDSVYLSRKVNYAPFYPREGKHLFTLHWLDWDKPGIVFIKKLSAKQYSVKGEHRNSRGFATIDGTLTPVKKGLMYFEGTIISKFDSNNNGQPCVKNGKYTFYCKPGRKYWRLQEMENCEESSLVDYIDIFF